MNENNRTDYLLGCNAVAGSGREKEMKPHACKVLLYYEDNQVYNISEAIDRLEPEILDRRRCYAFLFDYCPTCGEKIDWVKIKKLKGKK